jgi:hypothetical protein
LPILTLTDPRRHCSNYKRNVNVTCYAAALARVQSFFSCSHLRARARRLFVASICRDYVINFLTTFAGRTSNLEGKTNTA